MSITQRDIAAAAQVSRSTVAAVMSKAQRPRISPEVCQRVFAASEKLGYRPNRYAQVMRNGKSGMIGILDGEPLHQISQRKALSTARAVLRTKYEPIVQEMLWFSGQENNSAHAACQRMVDLRVEGVVLVHPSAFFKQENLEFLLRSGIPVVTISGLNLQGIPGFYSARERGYRDIVRHLFLKGYTRISVLASTDCFTKRGVLNAFHEAPKKKSKPKFYYPKISSIQNFPQEEIPYILGQIGMHKIFSRRPYPEAVICSNDNWALGALNVCFQAGIRVPEDIALTGYDDIPAARFAAVPITTVSQPIEMLVQKAVETLIDHIEKRAKQPFSSISLPGKLLIRKSSDGSFSPREIGPTL